METPPDPVKDGVARWRCCDLKAKIKTLFEVEDLRALRGAHLAGAEIPQAGPAAEAPQGGRGPTAHFSENFASILWKCLPEHVKVKPIEIWFQDEARVGQKGTLTRIWARKGSRPRAVCDTRYEWAYLFGAVCPERKTGAAIVMPYANTEAMNLHLEEISKAVAPGAHAALVFDAPAGTAARS